MIQQITFTLKPVTERLRLNKDKHNTLTNAITATLSEFRDVVINFAAIFNRSSHLQWKQTTEIAWREYEQLARIINLSGRRLHSPRYALGQFSENMSDKWDTMPGACFSFGWNYRKISNDIRPLFMSSLLKATPAGIELKPYVAFCFLLADFAWGEVTL